MQPGSPYKANVGGSIPSAPTSQVVVWIGRSCPEVQMSARGRVLRVYPRPSRPRPTREVDSQKPRTLQEPSLELRILREPE
jgi:hypothetical protein